MGLHIDTIFDQLPSVPSAMCLVKILEGKSPQIRGLNPDVYSAVRLSFKTDSSATMGDLYDALDIASGENVTAPTAMFSEHLPHQMVTSHLKLWPQLPRQNRRSTFNVGALLLLM